MAIEDFALGLKDANGNRISDEKVLEYFEVRALFILVFDCFSLSYFLKSLNISVIFMQYYLQVTRKSFTVNSQWLQLRCKCNSQH